MSGFRTWSTLPWIWYDELHLDTGKQGLSWGVRRDFWCDTSILKLADWFQDWIYSTAELYQDIRSRHVSGNESDFWWDTYIFTFPKNILDWFKDWVHATCAVRMTKYIEMLASGHVSGQEVQILV
jgi:hypothetical protein